MLVAKFFRPARRNKKSKIFSSTLVNLANVQVEAFTQLVDLLLESQIGIDSGESEKVYYDATIAFSTPL